MLRGRPRKAKKSPSVVMEKLIGLYEGDLLRYSLVRDLGPIDRSLYRFLRLFSDKLKPESFTRNDVDLFIELSKRDGVDSATTKRDIKHLRAFWNYLIDMHDYIMTNPFSERESAPWRKLRLKKLAEEEQQISAEDAESALSNTQ